MTAKSKGIAQCILYLHRNRFFAIIEIQFLIRHFIANCGMNIVFLNLFHTSDKLDRSGSSQHMSDHGFCGIDLHFTGMRTKCKFDRARLKEIVMVRGCSMCIDVIDLIHCDPCIPNGI